MVSEIMVSLETSACEYAYFRILYNSVRCSAEATTRLRPRCESQPHNLCHDDRNSGLII
jgi:hypothetical protein